MKLQTFHAVYLPVSYEPNAGSLELRSLKEGFALMGLRERDVIPLPLPKNTVYMSRKHQRAQKPGQENRGASLVVRAAGLRDLGIWGPALVVPRADIHTSEPTTVVPKKVTRRKA